MDFANIKLIIWDLDETLWEGTLSEGAVYLPEKNVSLIKDLTDFGIINSICSKNDTDAVTRQMTEFGVWDYFVFPSISWENKGPRIQAQIDRMALRPVNVLFIDDNHFNRQEALHHLPKIQTAGPEIIDDLIAYLDTLPNNKKDPAHKRLQQYKILEQKTKAAEVFESNEEFLYASDIRVNIHKDCLTEKERILELILRSNQLNFTKKRIDLKELESILSNPGYECGYVSVKDNYGDYGIVRFYATHDQSLEHFVFSCRTMGQMIEQYVYAYLGFPDLNVVGEVRTRLNKTDTPGWINQKKATVNRSAVVNKTIQPCKVLIKGPCDLSHALSYIHTNDSFVKELTYVKEGTNMVIDTYNHSVHIRGLKMYSEEDNRQIVADCPFVDPDMLHGTFFSGNYDIIFLSSLIESVYPIFKGKDKPIRVVYHDLKIADEKTFFDNYESEGETTPEQYSSFLKECLQWLPRKTTLCILLGTTFPYKGFEATARKHEKINKAVIDLAKENERLKYISLDDFIHGEKDFTNHINHYCARVYFDIAQAIIQLIQELTGEQVTSYGGFYVWLDGLMNHIKGWTKRHVSKNHKIYHRLGHIYKHLARK